MFNIKHQFKSLKTLKDALNEKEAVIHTDFSENYECKASEEVQGMHFGGSRNQASLHTVVVYTQGNVFSYCSLSDDTHHGPAAAVIWAHLCPVLDHYGSAVIWVPLCPVFDHLQTLSSKITSLHFISDGPTTQYRSKVNFFLYNIYIHEVYNFELASWNFTEAGHGKGAADDIGSIVKISADKLVASGKDIIDAQSLYTHLKATETIISIFYKRK